MRNNPKYYIICHLDSKSIVYHTAGNTSEPIDNVRSIINTASGKLGSIIADGFISEGVGIVYVCGGQ